MLPVTKECVTKLKGAGVIPVGVATQHSINEKGERYIKRSKGVVRLQKHFTKSIPPFPRIYPAGLSGTYLLHQNLSPLSPSLLHTHPSLSVRTIDNHSASRFLAIFRPLSILVEFPALRRSNFRLMKTSGNGGARAINIGCASAFTKKFDT